MRLDDLSFNLDNVKGDTNALIEFSKALNALPDGTVEGVSGYGRFTATIREGVVEMWDADRTSTDEILYHIPTGAENVVVSSQKGVSFLYKGHKYRLR